MIEIKGLVKCFGEHVIFKDFNLKVSDGEFLIIKGPSGCGKSTLLNIIGLLDDEYKGTLIENNLDIKKLNINQKLTFVRNNLNYLFQNYALINNTTVEKNLEIALYYTKYSNNEKTLRINEALKDVGLDNYNNRKIYTLSGGEQQRVALARLELKPGNIILADEPTGNLDEENGERIMDILNQLNQNGKTIIMVTHNPLIISKAAKVLSL